jgi:acyl-CoA synthetase (AMP-forming)/AMP-acid ligase II
LDSRNSRQPKACQDPGKFSLDRRNILFESSVDIIKTGGEKVSALEIKEVLRTHPAIKECAVVGVPDPVWGERVCAALVLKNGARWVSVLC